MKLKELRELTKNLTVLYVEDDEEIRKSMSEYLRKFFALVVEAPNGVEALKEYESRRFDVVVTDLSMPKMDGLEMLEKIKEKNEAQAVLVTTAHSESEYVMGAIKSHVDGYVLKPFDFEELNFELFKISNRLSKFKENEEYKNRLQEMVDLKTSQLKNMMDFQSENYDKTLFSMIEMIEQRDTYTAGHSKRVAEYCKKIAQEMAYDSEECERIHQAAILHDVGKIGTPDSVLLNPSRLNKIEYKLIQEHVEVSYKLLSSIPMFHQLAEIVYSHHERYDGMGYPRGLKGEEISPLARIMIVADAFDAMTTNRIYKARKSVEVAIEELKSLSEKQFHPEVIEKAVIALRDVKVDENVTQLPKSKLEEERFAYFYKDPLSGAYNQNYLDVVLMKNSYDLDFKNLDVFFVSHFSNYNKKSGWKEGDALLFQIATLLRENVGDGMVFRVFGDDFVVVSKERTDLSEVLKLLNELFKEKEVSYRTKNVDLSETEISRTTQLENF